MSEQPKSVGNFFLVVLIAVVLAIGGIFGTSAIMKRSKEEKRAAISTAVSETSPSWLEVLPIGTNDSENRSESGTETNVANETFSGGAEPSPELDRRLPEWSLTSEAAASRTATGVLDPVDQKAFEKAVVSRDPRDCSSIQEEAILQNCLDVTSMAYAIKVRDPAACSKIANPTVSADCRKAVEAVRKSD